MSETHIFTVGGTVQASNGMYIPRRADGELLALCRGGNFAYVLTPRQLGKSSLMVRTAEQLTAEGVRSVIIDLSQIGVQVTPEEWYLGLLSMIEEQLDLDTNAVSWWRERGHLGVTQRLTQFFEEVLLKEVNAPVVVFVDEIDTTLSLNFTDDFFAAIRYFYNARALSPDVRRLSFVLIGVATPGDLIRDPQRTPFNIGQRVDLTDFSLEEALPFAVGFGLAAEESRQVLGWVLKWTGGHPYLTQRLCRALTDDGKRNWTEADIDAMVGKTFFGRISEEDNNLQFVRDMLTKRAPDLAEVLYTYREVLNHKRPVQDEEQSLVKSHLKLSGVAHRKHGELSVRNPIYARVFNDAWVKQHLPVNWTKRLTRVAIGLVLTLMILSVPTSIWAIAAQRRAITERDEATKLRAFAEQQTEVANLERRKAETARNEAEEQRQLALSAAVEERMAREREGVQRKKAEGAAGAAQRQEALARSLAVSEARARAKAEDLGRQAEAARMEAEKLRAQAEEESKRNELQRDIAQGQGQICVASQLANQGEQLSSSNGPAAELLLARALTLDDRPAIRSSLLDARAKNARMFWERPIPKEEPLSAVLPQENRIVAFSPDKRFIAVAGAGGINILNAESGSEIRVLPQRGEPHVLLFSPDSKQLVVQSVHRFTSLWDVASGESISLPSRPQLGQVAALRQSELIYDDLENLTVQNIKSGKETRLELGARRFLKAFSADGRLLASGDLDGNITVLDLETRQALSTLRAPNTVYGLQFSENGRVLASYTLDESIFWDLQTGKRLASVPYAAFSQLSADGRTFAAVGADEFKSWEVATGKEFLRFPLNNLNLKQLKLGSAGQLATQDTEGTVRIFDLNSGELSNVFYEEGSLLRFSPDGQRFYSINDSKLKAWDLESNPAGNILSRHTGGVTSVAFSPDGLSLASGGLDQTIKIWNTMSGHQVGSLNTGRRIQQLVNFDPERSRVRSDEQVGASDVAYVLRDLNTGKEILSTSNAQLMNLFGQTRLSPDGLILANQKGDGEIQLRNLETGKELIFSPLGPGRPVLSFSPDGRQFAQGAASGLVKIWNIDSGTVRLSLNGEKGIEGLFFSDNNTRLALASRVSIEIWDLTKGSLVSTISKVSGQISDGLFTPNGDRFAAIVDNQRIRVWDVKTGNSVQTLSSDSRISGFLFSPDGRWLVSRSRDLRLWDIEEKDSKTGFVLPGSGSSNAAFDREGRRLAYGGRDGLVRLWNFEAVKHVYMADHWALFNEVKATTARRVKGLDFKFLPQLRVRDILGEKYSELYSLSEGTSQDEAKDVEAEAWENSLKDQPTHGGSISGIIHFEGLLPTLRRIDSSADPYCETKSPSLVTEDWIVADGKLANAFVYVKSGSRLDKYSLKPPTSEVVIERRGCRSLPRLVGVQTHQVVAFVNGDQTTHNYHITPKLNREWNQSLPPGAPTLYKEFDIPEIIPLKCNQHPWESSYIGVFSSPFFAVSAWDGSYTIAGLPPGTYTIVAWHEGGVERSVEITIGAGESKTQDFTLFKPTI